MNETQLTTALKARGLRLIDLANKVGVDKATATRWSQDRVPLKRVFEVEKAVGIPKEELRPDFFGETAQ